MLVIGYCPVRVVRLAVTGYFSYMVSMARTMSLGENNDCREGWRLRHPPRRMRAVSSCSRCPRVISSGNTDHEDIPQKFASPVRNSRLIWESPSS